MKPFQQPKCFGAVLPSLLSVVFACVVPIEPAAAVDDDYALLFRGGTSYYRVPGESRFGGAYGLETAFPISDDVGIMVSANINHLSGGTQFTGSTGLVKLPAQRPLSFQDALTGAVVFDQLTDSRIDTFTGSFYTNQIRWQGGYQIEGDLEIGVSGNIPLYETDDVLFRFVSFPASLPAAGIVSGSVSYGAYISGHSGAWQQSFYAGFRELPGTAQLSSSSRYQFDDRLAAITSTTFEERRHNWSLYFGLEFDIGPTQPNRCRSRRCIRAQSPASPIRMAAYVPPGGQTGDPEDKMSEFPLNLGEPADNSSDERTSSSTPRTTQPNPPAFVAETFGERWKKWDGKLELNRSGRDSNLNLNGKGLTNRVQNGIQAPFTRFSFGAGRTDGRDQD